MEKLKSENHYDKFSRIFKQICGDNFHVGYYVNLQQELKAANEYLCDYMATYTKLQPGETVVDVGCGVGGPARHIADKFQAKVVGVSNSETGITTANQFSHPDTSFVLLDALQLTSIGKDDFDVAWLMESSHLMADKSLLFHNIAATTHSGGRFILCDFFLKSKNDTLNKAHLYKMRNIFKAFGKLKLLSPESYVESATSAGFTEILVEDISIFVEPTFEHWASEACKYSSISPEFRDFATAAGCLGDLFREGVLTYNIIKGHKK